MAEVTNELLYELMKSFHKRFDNLDFKVTEVKSELQSMRGTLISVQQDIHNIYMVLGRHGDRLDRIDRRLDLRELAESPTPYVPQA
jgi:tetrahydromethanopterin S-methyltransferase subunit G